MFKNLLKFYNATKAKNVYVIGFTATAFDGKEDGIEMKALNSLGYKVYRSCAENQVTEPKINEKVAMKTFDQCASVINQQR